jgi:hypothetical protein
VLATFQDPHFVTGSLTGQFVPPVRDQQHL